MRNPPLWTKFKNILKMSKTDWPLVGVGLFVLMLVLALVLSIGLEWNQVGKSFFQFKLTDILQLAATLTVGLVISYLLNRRTSNESRRRDIYLQLLERIQKTIETVYSVGVKYADNPEPVLQKKVLSSLKSAGIALTTLRSVKGSSDFTDLNEYEVKIVNKFIRLRKTLTESPFGQVGKPYPQHRKIEFEQGYQLLLSEIYNCKFQIFS